MSTILVMKISFAILSIRYWTVFAIFTFTQFPAVKMHNWKPPSEQPKYGVCRTIECQRRGAMYYKNMNSRAHPCVDFYQFACGNWRVTNPRPEFASKWNVDDDLHYKALTDIQKFLESPITSGESKMETNAKKLHQKCVRRAELPRGDIDFVTEKITRISARTLIMSIWHAHAEYLRLSGESAFFNVVYKLNDDNNIMLQFREVDSAYGSIYHTSKWTQSEEVMYTEFLSELYQMLNSRDVSPKRQNEEKDLLTKVIQFRHELNTLARKNSGQQGTDWLLGTVGELMKWYKKIAYKTQSTDINWATIVRILYPELTQADMKSKPIVSIRRKEYFVGLALLLSKTTPRILLKHMQLYFMERHLTFNGHLKSKLESILSETKTAGRIREDLPRWVTCLEEYGSELQLAKIYVKNFIPAMNQPYIQHLIKDMQTMLKNDIKNSWLNGNAKRLTVLTINNMQFSLSFPKWDIKLTDKLLVAEKILLNPRAYYDPDKNKLYFSAAILRSPIYDSGLPMGVGVNIASLGSTIGRELYRTFGDCGSYADNLSGKSKVWWWRHAHPECESKKQCFVNQYNEYAMLELKSAVNLNVVDSTECFAKNAADVMGLRMAYQYYKEKAMRMKHACQVLPYFEEYTCDQLFFIAFANSMCENTTPEYLAATYSTADYNPRSLRVNGALRNLEAFQEAFACQPGSPMNPTNKCSLWD